MTATCTLLVIHKTGWDFQIFTGIESTESVLSFFISLSVCLSLGKMDVTFKTASKWVDDGGNLPHRQKMIIFRLGVYNSV